MLVSGNLGIFGDSGSSKSWVTGLLAEGMHLAGYQVLLIDPEGDFRGLRSLPGIIALSGDATTLPTPSLVAMLLEEASISVVLDLCLYPVAQREFYIAELLHALRPMREHKFRPHWIVLEEAQSLLPPARNAVLTALQPMLDRGGLAFVSYRPDRLAEPVLAALNRCLAARLSEPESVLKIERLIQAPTAERCWHVRRRDRSGCAGRVRCDCVRPPAACPTSGTCTDISIRLYPGTNAFTFVQSRDILVRVTAHYAEIYTLR